MKKVLSFIAALFVAFSLFAAPADSVQQLTLENGLTVFLLEDTSTPFIRVEYTAKAGFSNQTQNTNGFFKLYSRVLKTSMPQIEFERADCYADSSRYITTITTSKAEETFSLLAKQAFCPDFSNELISSQLLQLKKEVAENASELSTLINAAIDSKVFSSSPWKHDSGLYSPLFQKTTIEKARTILSEISQRWYTPQNSAVFVSGNINSQQILSLIQNTFGAYYSTYQVPIQKEGTIKNTQKKFVIHDPEMSSEMTQVVVQYTGFNSMEDCDIAAAILNNNSSFFKFNLLSQEDLNIPGHEYINAQSAYKKNSNRLIIQSLLQSPEDKNLAKKTTSVTQALNFLKQTKVGIEQITPGEFNHFQKQLVFDINFSGSSTTVFMDKLSSWWAIEPYFSSYEEIFDNSNGSTIVQNFLNRDLRLQNSSLPIIQEQFLAEEPYLFVIIGSSDYKKNKDAYAKAGFEVITKANASWYNQKIYDDVKAISDIVPATQTKPVSYENDYYNRNKEQILTTKLLNGIPVYTKHNNNSSQITLLLSIRGGKLNSSNDNGFEEVMVSLLTTNIQKEIYNQAQAGYILGIPNVDYEVQTASSYIILECEKEDFEICCRCISNALIYGDIIPSSADRAVSNRQYQKRLENGTVTYQMYCAMIEALYPKSDLSKIYTWDKEILENTSYQHILETYPKLLDASRYSLILTGNYDENYAETLNKTLGLLVNQNGAVNYSGTTTKMSKNNTVTVKVNHTFLTDIPAEKAGPMPAVLVPTKEFIDPVIYVFQTPEAGTKKSAIFDALLYYIENRLNLALQNNSTLKDAKAFVTPAKSSMEAATITIQNVSHTKAMDNLFYSLIEEISLELKQGAGTSIATQIKDTWIKQILSKTTTNTGNAILIQKGMEYFPFEQNPYLYLEEYNHIQNAELSDFIDIMEYFPAKPQLIIYSKEGKK